MGLKMITNPSSMEVRLLQIGDRAMKGMSDRMHRVAIRIRDLARDYAPVKTGLLEDSIDYEIQLDGRRKSFVVYIDLDATKVTSAAGSTTELGEYAPLMEEGLRPYGKIARYKLGPGSTEKRMTGRKVGGRFLGRAISEGTKDILGEMAREVRRATSRGPSAVGTQFQVERMGDDE